MNDKSKARLMYKVSTGCKLLFAEKQERAAVCS